MVAEKHERAASVGVLALLALGFVAISDPASADIYQDCTGSPSVEACDLAVQSAQELEDTDAEGRMLALRALAHFNGDDHANAGSDYAAAFALGIEPDAATLTNYGYALFKTGDTAGALAELDRAVRMAPRVSLTRRYRGEARLEDGNVIGAIGDLQIALGTGTDLPETERTAIKRILKILKIRRADPETPRGSTRRLERAQVVEVQLRLNNLGFDVGRADGDAGPRTRRGASAFAKVAGIDGRVNRGLLDRLRLSSAVEIGMDDLPACEEGQFRTASFYETPQAVRTWSVAIDPQLIEQDRDLASWVEVKCGDNGLAETATYYYRGELDSVWSYTYDGAPTPTLIEKRNADGEVDLAYDIGRTAEGHLIYIRPKGARGAVNRTVVALDGGDHVAWHFIALHGQQNIDYHLEYDHDGMMSRLVTMTRSRNDVMKVIYHYDPETHLNLRNEKFRNDEKYEDAVYERDVFGNVEIEKLTHPAGSDRTHNNRQFENGLLVRDEWGDVDGNTFVYEFRHDGELYAGGRLSRNGEHLANITVERDGDAIIQTALNLPDGTPYATYPAREIRYVEADGTPSNGGSVERLIETPLW